MYQGTNKTALRSQTRIADALVHLMKEKPYTAISISAICKEAEISRQTFYSLFGNKEDVITFAFKKYAFHPEESSPCNASTLSLAALCESYSRYIINTLPILTLLTINDMTHFFEERLNKCLSEHPTILADADQPNREFAIAFAAGGLTSVVRTYVQSSDKFSQADLTELIYNLFSGKSFQH